MIKLKQSGPICSYNNQAYQVCINYDCKSNPFVCNCQNKCQCESHHLQCDKINWQYIKNKLNSSIIKNNPQFQSFSNTVESLYQSLIKQITKSYNDFKLWRDHFGLTQKESQFVKLIEEGRYSEMTGQSIYEIRKQIKLPSKILLKAESEIKKEIQMINTYAQSILLQFNELYSKNKVEKINEVENKENKRVNQEMSEQNKQVKLNLAHKLLGLNQKGSKFLTMLNEGIIETKLQNIQVSFKAVDLRIEKLTQTISDHKNEMKTENSQLKKEILQYKNQMKSQNNEIKKEFDTIILELRNENQTQFNDMKKQVIDMKKEATQFRNENQTQFNDMKKQVIDMKKEATQFRNEMKSENAQFRNQVKTEISSFKNEINKEIIQSRNQLKNEIQTIKNQMNKEILESTNEIKKEISQNKNEIKSYNNGMKQLFTNKILQLRNENKTQYNDMKKQVTDMKKEATQFRNENKTQYDQITKEMADIKKQVIDMKKEQTQFRKQNKQEHLNIKNYGEIFKQQIIIKTKINNIKSKVNPFSSQKNKQLKMFIPQYQKKIKIAESLNKIQEKVPSILKNHTDKKLSIDNLCKQFISVQKQTELLKQQFQFFGIQMEKINAISYLFSKKITKLDLLYRASQNNFQVSKFHEKCDGKQHTITILKTQFGNVIGGYTPLPWDKNKHGNYQADNSMQSFIFSLTNKHKLTLIQGQQHRAIRHYSDQGPAFGGGDDMVIKDKANQNRDSYGRPGHTYNNNNEYVWNTQQSYKKWSGQSSGYYFKILQWQVYAIVFA